MSASIFGRRALVGFALALMASVPAHAATYQIGLLEGGTGAGAGSFTFTNSGASGPTTASLSTNASSGAGAQSFGPGTLNVQVVAVNFTDNKTPPNQITGNFVEGMTGTLRTAATNIPGCGLCYYQIAFAFTPSPSNPDAAGKTYTIERRRQSNDNLESTPVPNGNYSVANTATIPEPNVLALLALALAALGFAELRRRQHDESRIGA